MPKILKALLEFQIACEAAGIPFHWDAFDLNGEGRWLSGLAVQIEIPMTEEDFTFLQQARQMFAPA